MQKAINTLTSRIEKLNKELEKLDKAIEEPQMISEYRFVACRSGVQTSE